MVAWVRVMVEGMERSEWTGIYFGDRSDLMGWWRGIKEKEDA